MKLTQQEPSGRAVAAAVSVRSLRRDISRQHYSKTSEQQNLHGGGHVFALDILISVGKTLSAVDGVDIEMEERKEDDDSSAEFCIVARVS
jgi:hypothetical protein